MAGHIKLAFAVGVSSLALGIGTPVQAQNAAAGEESATSDGGIGEIIVTAQLREENLQDKAVNAARLALHSHETPKVSLDQVIETMR